MEPLISIIVPVYNVKDYLTECVESLVGQFYQNYEIILVDDGSKDESGEICEELSKTYDKIVVIHKANGGLSSARNAGLEVAKGTFVCFIDSDDFVSPYYLLHMVELQAKYDADIVCCAYQESEHFDKWDDEEESDIIVRHGSEIEDNMFVNDRVITVAWNKLYSIRFFKELGLRYPERNHEDMFFTPKVLYFSNCMVITSEKLYFYRQRQGSLFNSPFNETKLDKVSAIEDNIAFFEKCGKSNIVYLYLDGYIRNLIHFYKIMREIEDEKYKARMLEYEGKFKELRKKYIFDKNVEIKIKVKLLIWRILVRR